MNSPLQLRDIHLPEPVSWWPPAPGWWLLLLLVFVIVLLLRRFMRQRSGHQQLRVGINRTLRELQDGYAQHQDAQRYVQDASAFLRRVALSLRPREQVAALTGDEWLDLLDELAARPCFQGEIRELLHHGSYRPVAEQDTQELMTQVRHWVSCVQAQHKRWQRQV